LAIFHPELSLYWKLELDGENWDLGIFEYGDSKYDISFLIRARGGLQTGSKISKNGKMIRLR